MKEVKLPSGAVLNINVAPFKDSRNLYQAVLEEGKALKLDPGAEIDVNLYKDLACIFLASKKVENALWVCMGRCLYNGMKIVEDTFEPESARDDYLRVMFEVAKENVLPFTKSLYAEYSQVLGALAKPQA